MIDQNLHRCFQNPQTFLIRRGRDIRQLNRCIGTQDNIFGAEVAGRKTNFGYSADAAPLQRMILQNLIKRISCYIGFLIHIRIQVINRKLIL